MIAIDERIYIGVDRLIRQNVSMGHQDTAYGMQPSSVAYLAGSSHLKTWVVLRQCRDASHRPPIRQER